MSRIDCDNFKKCDTPLNSALFAWRRSERHQANSASLHAIQSELHAAADDSEAIKIDLRFHRALANTSGNLMVRLILESVADVRLESRQRTIGRTGKQTAIEHHAKILDAIEKHDPDAAALAMTEHLLAAGKDLAR